MTLEKYKRIAFWPIGILSLLFLYIFCSTNFHTNFAESNQSLISTLYTVIWILFATDYLIMFALAKEKTKFLKENVFYLVVVVVPFLRVFRIGLLIVMLSNLVSNLKNRVLLSVPIYTGVATLLFTLLGASAVYNAEYREDGANIKTPEDALWWAVVTIFTVGYGDRYPVTREGRLYGTALMLCGIAIVGTVTATFAGWLISQIREVESENAEILKKLKNLESKMELKND